MLGIGTFVTPAEVFADLSPYSGGGSAKTVEGARDCRMWCGYRIARSTVLCGGHGRRAVPEAGGMSPAVASKCRDGATPPARRDRCAARVLHSRRGQRADRRLSTPRNRTAARKLTACDLSVSPLTRLDDCRR